MKRLRRKRVPRWIGASVVTSKKGGVMREKYFCSVCGILKCHIIIPLNDFPPRKCKEEVKNGRQKTRSANLQSMWGDRETGFSRKDGPACSRDNQNEQRPVHYYRRLMH